MDLVMNLHTYPLSIEMEDPKTLLFFAALIINK